MCSERNGNAQRPKVEQGNAPARGMAEKEKVMKATAILKQVLTMCETEHQGVIDGGVCESWREWLRDWFGIDAVLNAGLIDPERAYFYTYGDPLKGVADAIITADGGAKVYIYEVEE